MQIARCFLVAGNKAPQSCAYKPEVCRLGTLVIAACCQYSEMLLLATTLN